MSKEISRRKFLKIVGIATAGIILNACKKKKEELPTALTTATEKLQPTAAEQPTVAKQPTATATETSSATEQPTVAQTETAKETELKKAVEETIKNWPKTSEEATKMFGGKSSDWEISPDGGWHFIERSEREIIDPNNCLMEGYCDTAPGKNPFCFVTWGSAAIQGGTIWPKAGNIEAAKDLVKKMAIPKWDDGSQHPCQIIEPTEKQGE